MGRTFEQSSQPIAELRGIASKRNILVSLDEQHTHAHTTTPTARNYHWYCQTPDYCSIGALEHWTCFPSALLPPSSSVALRCCSRSLLPSQPQAPSHSVESFQRCAAHLPCSTDPPHPNPPALTALPPRTRALHLPHTLASSSMGSAWR